MDIREYIDSGKLESYVLGHCTSEEMQEAECMARIFPEVRHELESIRASMEKYAISNKVEPPADLKSRIFDAIEREEIPVARTEPKIISIDSVKQTGSSPFLKLLIAACVVIIMITSFSVFMLSKKKDQLNAQLNDLKNEQQLSNIKYDKLNDRFNKLNEQVLVMIDPDEVHVTMKGTPLSPQSVAMIYWNKQSKDVYIAVNSLPQAPAGKQYQLWGIVDGKPVDLGVFDIQPKGDSSLQKMKTVSGATTFAVTLENAGGSPVPSLDKMYVAGNI